MSYREQGTIFNCAGEALLGVLALPAGESSTEGICHDIAVVIVVGGPQYRAGSHRQFTLLARALADTGYPAFRFDYRGMGDSTGERRNFDQVSDDLGAAIDAVRHQLPQVKKLVLWGLCDGASATLLYLHTCADPRVSAICLVNPWVRTTESLAQARIKSYYAGRVASLDVWRKLLLGRVSLKSVRDFGRSLAVRLGWHPRSDPDMAAGGAQFIARMSSAASTFSGDLLIVLCERDLTGQEFAVQASAGPAWRAVLGRPRTTCLSDAQADHTFSQPDARQRLEQYTIDWLRRCGQRA